MVGFRNCKFETYRVFIYGFSKYASNTSVSESKT